MENNKPTSIRKKSDFLELKNKGKKLNLSKWLFVTYKENQNERLRYGIILSRKVGNSVTRNKLRRWCREFIRSNYKQFGHIDLNLIFKPMEKDFFKNLDHKAFLQTMNSLEDGLLLKSKKTHGKSI